MTPGEEKRLEDLLHNLELTVTNGFTHLNTKLEGYDKLEKRVSDVEDAQAEARGERRGARRAQWLAFTLVQLAVSAGVVGWVSTQSPG